MARVFISFVHEDVQVAKAVRYYLTDKLKLGQDDVFLSSNRSQVIAGEDWFERIKKELKRADVLVVLLSKRSVGRPWVNFEAGAAWLAGKPIVSVCYGHLTKKDLPKPYLDLQSLDLPGEKQYLLESIATYLGCRPPTLIDHILEDMQTRPKGLFEQFELADMLTIEFAVNGFSDEES